MSDGDGDADDAAPLADLARAVSDGEPDEVWDRLEATLDGDAATDDDVWDRLAATEDRTAVGEPRAVPVADRVPAWATISEGAKILHGYLTALLLGGALALYAAAAAGAIPRWAWILSLPPFALGVVFLVPILAWYLGVWDPTRIG